MNRRKHRTSNIEQQTSNSEQGLANKKTAARKNSGRPFF